jgi:hypothetical protein
MKAATIASRGCEGVMRRRELEKKAKKERNRGGEDFKKEA